ncbi:MAG: hypothetical protein WA116_08075 [Anaerolineaceae bacterium]
MQEELLEISTYTGEGYQPLIDFNCWRVAFLRYLDDLEPAKINLVEKHLETDEVFVLLAGQGVLFLGAGDEEVIELIPEIMQPCQLYNVKKNVWHTILLSRDATVLLVENRDTSVENSDYCDLRAEHRQYIQTAARELMPDWWGG